jgi:hypothetical protein
MKVIIVLHLLLRLQDIPKAFLASDGVSTVVTESGVITIVTKSGTLYPETDGFQFLVLRDGFDWSHPALHLPHLLSLLAKNKTLPRLPGVPDDNLTSYRLPKAFELGLVGNLLFELGNAGGFCCNTIKAGSCSTKWLKRTEISDPCNYRGKEVCMKCDIAGSVLLAGMATIMDMMTTLLDVTDKIKNVKATFTDGRSTLNELEDLWSTHMDVSMAAFKLMHTRDTLTDVRAMLTIVSPTFKEARMWVQLRHILVPQGDYVE